MKKLIWAGLVVIVMAGGSRPFAVTNNQVVVAPILERMGQAFSAMQSLKASLRQQKTYGQLGIADPVEQGALYIKRKSPRDIFIRLEITQPMQRIITVKDNRFILFQPNINQAIEGKVEKSMASKSTAAGFLTYFFGGVSKAAQDYDIAALGEEVLDGRRATHLRLTPRTSQKGLYQQIDLWVDNQLWIPTQQRFVETNQEVTAVQLLNVQVNVSVPDKLFTQQIPSNTQRVRG